MDEIEAAMADTSWRIAQKEQELKALRLTFAELRAGAEELQDRRTPDGPDVLRQTVADLAYGQMNSDAQSNAYTNRVVALELRSLVDRYKLLDVEGMAEQNHALREEVFRLQQENLKFIQAVAEGDTKTRRQTAQVQLALEATAREHFRQVQDSLRREMYEQIDEKTKLLVHEHGALQAQVRELNKQAGLIDSRYRQMSTERQQFKVDSHVSDGMNEIMSKQVATLRLQLDQAFLMNRSLEDELDKAEARALRAEAEVQRLEERWKRRERSKAQGEWPDDAEDVQWQHLQEQLGYEKLAQAKLREQRNWWRERCRAHERTNAELQATLQALIDKSGLTLPGGAQQSVDSVWRGEHTLSAQASSTSNKTTVTTTQRRKQAEQPGAGNSSQAGKEPDSAVVPSTHASASTAGATPGDRAVSRLAGTVSLSRLVHDSTEAVHMQYQPQVTGLRPQRTAGSLRYGSPRTSALEVYQLDSVGSSSHRPVSAKLALEADRKAWQRQQARRTSSPVSTSLQASPSKQPVDGYLRPASAASVSAVGGPSAAGSNRPATAGPARPGTAKQRASSSLVPMLFKSRSGAFT